ncbi:prepilin-type N-terminal cleavage/methylation domain-containing protein [Desulfosporosinus orientis DSM 765]|uniref:Prepilin-type N-terminal cleavage/methylation domain-containing protein n=1 Tax=Desulfosporosinus orientis (strain ATCC 19365 / DSM 765 / NCIMB 8382 / VKM B-1628 / Singapore I) TaxID=768706 RepID=G7W837_DESOD|nr:type II secretion system protein [Desulfosporosinus orientis]AET66683.1 prepilin-type N-terminal cleavage/methylation domain-containing protein [Desulfosporosinus orientis DSM 765]
MQLNRKAETQEQGMTLMEVLFALLISGIFLMVAMGLFTDQWRGARVLKNHLEAQYSVLTAGKTLSDAIRMSQRTTWEETGQLKVLPLPDESTPRPTQDSYFLDDLDGNGQADLYWRHAGVSQPVASHLISWECREVEPGLWKIVLQAKVDGQGAAWQTLIRQRVIGLAP